MQSLRTFALLTTLVAGTALVTAGVVSARQDRGAPAEAAPGMDPAMMMKMMELATPGAEHRELGKMVGTWNNKFKMRMAPDAPWMEAEGTSTIKPLLDGRYVLEEVEFSVMGMPMKGIQIMGYDKLKQEYVSVWLDSMGTWPVSARGKSGADGKIEMRGTMIDVAGERPYRMVIQHKSADEVQVEMYDTIPPQGEVQVMSIHATRKP
jgi:hypothetical protein